MEVAEETKTEFRFEELSDSAQQKVREKYHHWVHGHEWWDVVYEDFILTAEKLGFTIEKDRIHFSGFWSQGDGACFSGYFRSPKESAHTMLKEAGWDDKELLALADRVDLLIAPHRLLDPGAYWRAKIGTYGSYCHSGTMQVDEIHDSWSDNVTPDDLAAADIEILAIARALADWLYEKLEEEHDYLDSDETVTERFQDERFDESGLML